jgi:hypothetical protein
MLNDLDRPLGLDRKERKPVGGRKPLWAAGAGLAVALAAGGAWLIAQQDDGRQAQGGEPEARAPIQPLLPPAPPQPIQVQQAAPEPARDAALSGQRVDIENGVRVVRGGGGVGPAIIHVPDDAGALAPAPDPRLVERSRFGLLPQRGRDGATPAQVYARPRPALKPGLPRIALIVGGMGLNDLATQSAISRLPAAVTLAFAPYGARVEHLAGAARDAGHEILLQAPMEPYNDAESPGPHVIPAGDAPRAEDELRWQMGRMVGYFGVINYLGGKVAADRDSVAALMAELARRGLDYIDDGSAPQSLAGEAASEKGVDFLKVDVRIDDARRSEAIDAALIKLENLAKQKGFAVGFASGLPTTSERIANYLADLKRSGVVLVPVSAAFGAGDKR